MAPKKPAKPFKSSKVDIVGGLTPAAEEDASHDGRSCINRQLFQQFQEDLACSLAHALFSNIQKADAVDIQAKKDSVTKQPSTHTIVRWP